MAVLVSRVRCGIRSSGGERGLMTGEWQAPDGRVGSMMTSGKGYGYLTSIFGGKVGTYLGEPVRGRLRWLICRCSCGATPQAAPLTVDSFPIDKRNQSSGHGRVPSLHPRQTYRTPTTTEEKGGGASLTGSLCLSNPLGTGRRRSPSSMLGLFAIPLKNPHLAFPFHGRAKPARCSLSVSCQSNIVRSTGMRTCTMSCQVQLPGSPLTGGQGMD